MHGPRALHQQWYACSHTQWPKLLNTSLQEVDPDLYDIIEKEKNRQWKVCVFVGVCVDVLACFCVREWMEQKDKPP